MAAATAMDPPLPQDRRLSINKSSAKISKSASLKKPASATAPPRPLAKVVNADPSSFRRVVQELTGSPTPSAESPPSSRPSPSPPPSEPRPSRLQRIAPPPLRPDFRSIQQTAAGQQEPNPHQQFLLLHQQHQQQQLHQQLQQHRLEQQHKEQQQHMKMMIIRPPPPPLMASLPAASQHNPFSSLLQAPFISGNTNLSISASAPPPAGAQFTLSSIPPLPMLSPHLLSPLPVLTPGDNTWASPLDVIPPPPPASLSFSAPNPPSANRFDSTSSGAEVHRASAPPPLLNPPPLHMPPAGRFSWPPSLPWSPRFAPSSLPPISPSFFPPSPGFGLGTIFSAIGPNGAAMNFGTPHGIAFQGSCDNGIFKPS